MKPILFLLLLVLVAPAASQAATFDRNILFFFMDGSYTDSITMTAQGTELPTTEDWIFDLIPQESPNNFSVSVKEGWMISCPAKYSLLDNQIYIVPVTEETVLYIRWDLNFNNIIDKEEIVLAATYWTQNQDYSRDDLFKVINKYFLRTPIIERC